MASARDQSIIGAVILLIVIILLGFLYASYIGIFRPSFVAAVATSGLVLVTAVSVILTMSVLNEQRRSREQNVLPAFKTELKGMFVGQNGIVIRNIGNGPAKDIQATIKIHPQGHEEEISYPTVAPGRVVPVGNPFDEINLNPQEFDKYDKITVEGTCEDIIGNQIIIDDELELVAKSVEATTLSTKSSEESLGNISDALNDISRELDDIERKLE